MNQEIMYSMCEFPPPICKPYLHIPGKHLKYAENLIAKALPRQAGKLPPLVGINTGSGSRWPKKMLNAKQIVKLIKDILNHKLVRTFPFAFFFIICFMAQ